MKIHELIEEAFEKSTEDKARRYIGASIVGNECEAYLSLSLRGFKNDPVNSRLKRIFRDGHRIEDVVIADMKLAKVNVIDRDPISGQQFEYNDYDGHVSGHADGVIEEGEECLLLEVKSMNDKKWNMFREKGVAKSHPLYFAQMQYMMGKSGMRRGILIAYNKNTSEYHSEEVKFDTFYFAALQAKIERVMDKGEGVRIARDRADYRCSGCFKRTACWKGVEEKACSLCKFAEPAMDKKWKCNHPEVDEVVEAEHVCPKFEMYVPRSR
jgi:hypothetical protein